MKKSVLALVCALIMLCACLPMAAAEEVQVDSDGFSFVVLPDGTAEVISYTSEATSRRQPNATIKAVVFKNRVGKYTISNIRQNPFYLEAEDFTQLCAASVMPGHKSLEVIEGVLFVKATHRLVSYPVFVESDTYAAPKGTLTVAAYAFAGAEHLKNITLPEGVTAIEAGAFRNCTALAMVVIPASVTAIDETAFENCGENLNIIVKAGSYAESFCAEHELPYTAQ